MSAVVTALAAPPDCAVIDANADAARLFATTLQEMRGASLVSLLAAAGVLGPLRDAICGALVTGGACSARIHVPRNAHTDAREVTLIATREAASPHVQVTVSERDAELQPSLFDLPVDAIVGVISHELRSPLNAMLVWATLLEMDDERTTVKKASAIIRDNIRTQARFIDDLVEVSRAGAGAMPRDSQRIDVGDLVAATLAEAREHIEVEIGFESRPQRYMVYADSSRLQRALQHLLDNAAAAMPASGVISTTVVPSGDSVCIAIADQGVGMTDEQISNAFRPLRHDHRGGHAGLGLAVVWAIVRQHGAHRSLGSTHRPQTAQPRVRASRRSGG